MQPGDGKGVFSGVGTGHHGPPTCRVAQALRGAGALAHAPRETLGPAALNAVFFAIVIIAFAVAAFRQVTYAGLDPTPMAALSEAMVEAACFRRSPAIIPRWAR